MIPSTYRHKEKQTGSCINFFCSILICLLVSDSGLAADKEIRLPIRFHIVSDMEIPKGSQILKTWISEEDIKSLLLPELNRIWKTANISFIVDSIEVNKSLNPPNKKQITGYLANADRDENGKADPERIKLLSQMINFNQETPKGLNIYFVPYLGETSQGHAKRSFRRAFVGQWTDKASKGKRAPERFKLVEKGTFKEGSIARTVAHEIGHLLNLKHPDKATQTEFKRLMGGKKPGYSLTSKEIKRARKKAKELSVYI